MMHPTMNEIQLKTTKIRLTILRPPFVRVKQQRRSTRLSCLAQNRALRPQTRHIKIRSFGLICQSFIFLVRRDYLFPNQFFKDDRFSTDGFPTIRLSHSVLVDSSLLRLTFDQTIPP